MYGQVIDIKELSDIPYDRISWVLAHGEMDLVGILLCIREEIIESVRMYDSQIPHLFDTPTIALRTGFVRERDRLTEALACIERLIPEELG